MEGFKVNACSTSADAIKLFAAGPTDLAIMDIGLPDGNGLELCQKLGLGPGSKIPFMFLTARGELNMRVACFKAGAQDYIQKPFAIEELLARVHVHLGLKRNHDELLVKNEQLEVATRVRQDLADMITHDLKAPLTSIKGSLELVRLCKLVDDGRYKQLLENAETAADFMLLMLSDLLDISQAQQVGLRANIGDVALAPLFLKLKGLFHGICERRHIRFEYKLDPGLTHLSTDQNLLFRILSNLITNAVKHSRKDEAVIVEYGKSQGKTRFVVSDRGPGVPDQEKTRIFEKYITLSRRRTEEDSSTGIGLTFCRLAAEALKGKIWVQDREGGGSHFILEF